MSPLMPAKHRSHALSTQAKLLRGGVIAAALVLSFAAGAAASDNGKAERLYTKGLAELHAGRNEKALALFQQAVEVNPKDIRAVYYRALGYGHAGRYEEAAKDLEVVVAANDPSIHRDKLELGYAYYRLERFDRAAEVLQVASKQPRNAGESLLLLGIVEMRRENYEAARADLAQVEAREPSLALAARYYQGVAAYRAGDGPVATTHFTWVTEQPGDTAFSREAAEFLESMQSGVATRPWRLHAGLAFEYDSNVVLAPDDDSVAEGVYGISNEDDGRAVITAGGSYSLLSRPDLRLAVGYDFLQSLHFELDEYNIQTHRPGVEGAWLHGPITVGLAAYYEHILLDDDSLLNGGNVLPWFRYDEGDFGRTEAYYRLRARDFVHDDYSPRRDAVNHAIGARQFFSLGSRSRNIIVGYRFDTEVADSDIGEEFDYNGHQFEGGIEWDLPWGIYADALYAYKLEDYDGASNSPGTFDGRDDDEHTLITRLEKQLCDYFWLYGAYIYRRNNSDQVSFEYERHITSLGVEMRY